MKIVQAKKTPIIGITCCLHGDELFGLKIFEYFKAKQDQYPKVKCILAHELAIEKNARFIEKDLNRSFPGNPNGTIEEKLAAKIMPEIINCQYVIDIHTTYSDLKLTPIITQLNQATKKIISHSSAKKVTFIKPPINGNSLIDHIGNGVSMEFGRQYAKTGQALNETIRIIKGLHDQQTPTPIKREIYYVTANIPKTTKIPASAKNFEIIPELGVYPVLLYEKAYTEIHALAATDKKTGFI
jgi:hypothetical protein